VPGNVAEQGGGTQRDAVTIASGERGVTRVEIRRASLQAAMNTASEVSALTDPCTRRTSRSAVAVEVGHLPGSMHARVGASRSHHGDGNAQAYFQGPLPVPTGTVAWPGCICQPEKEVPRYSTAKR